VKERVTADESSGIGSLHLAYLGITEVKQVCCCYHK